MAKLFRKSALDKLQSPQQLDKIIIVTRPSVWISIIGVCLIIVAALIWAVTGTIPYTVEAEGIFISSEGTAAEGDQEDVVILYVPVSSGKSIEVGMEVKIYPTTVSDQEYGHMEAVVTDVEEYVTSKEEMLNLLGNELLADSFLEDGAVVSVTCQLKSDPGTESGYYWSADKGSEVTLTRGTLVSADIITDEKAPISLLIPFLKGGLVIDSQEGGE